jgi:hypothetical protein
MDPLPERQTWVRGGRWEQGMACRSTRGSALPPKDHSSHSKGKAAAYAGTDFQTRVARRAPHAEFQKRWDIPDRHYVDGEIGCNAQSSSGREGGPRVQVAQAASSDCTADKRVLPRQYMQEGVSLHVCSRAALHSICAHCACTLFVKKGFETEETDKNPQMVPILWTWCGCSMTSIFQL